MTNGHDIDDARHTTYCTHNYTKLRTDYDYCKQNDQRFNLSLPGRAGNDIDICYIVQIGVTVTNYKAGVFSQDHNFWRHEN